MSILVGAGLIAAIAAAWVVYPLLIGRWGMLGDVVAADAVDRHTRRRVALAALKEAEYDRVAGKLDEADYQAIRSRLEIEALEALRAAEATAAMAQRGAASHGCGFVNPTGSRFCAGCGQRLP